MSLAARVVARFAMKSLASTVVARFKEARAWDDKFVGKNARLSWSRATWLLEELPQKGKKKQDPNALKSVPWAKFNEWLDKQKIPYDIRFSNWS